MSDPQSILDLSELTEEEIQKVREFFATLSCKVTFLVMTPCSYISEENNDKHNRRLVDDCNQGE